MDYIDYEDILRRKRALGDLLSTGTFDPKNESTEDIRWAQRLIGTKDDGVWGKTSQDALDTYRKSYDGPVKFRWRGMEGNEAAQAYSAWDTRQIELEERVAANEQRIEKLKQEYLVLQQEQETDTEALERNVAANRAGIGDTSQYNAWRARVDAREASKQAREADSEATLRQAKSRLNNALLAKAYARGDKETAASQQVYEDELAAYNELARKLGAPEISESELVNKDTVTMFDTKDFIRQHRNSKGQWDSEENRQKAYEMAKSLGDEGVPLLDEIYGQITTKKAAKKQNDFMDKLKKEVEKLKADNPASGNHTVTVDGKEYTVTIKGVDAGKKYAAYFDGNRISEPWDPEEVKND